MAWQAHWLLVSGLLSTSPNSGEGAPRCGTDAYGQISWLPLPLDAHQTGAMLRTFNIPPPTLENMRQAAPWLWVNCRNPNCLHRVALAITPFYHSVGRGHLQRSTSAERPMPKMRVSAGPIFGIRRPEIAILPSHTTRERRIGLVREGRSLLSIGWGPVAEVGDQVSSKAAARR